MQNGIQVKSADTSIVENRLRNTQLGDVVKYEELSKLLGRDAVEFCRANIASARRALVLESIFFDCIPNVGFKRLTSEEAIKASQHYVTRARRASRRGLLHLQHVPFDALSDEDKKQHLATSAQLGAIELFASNKATKKLTAAVEGSKALAIGETLKLFGAVLPDETRPSRIRQDST